MLTLYVKVTPAQMKLFTSGEKGHNDGVTYLSTPLISLRAVILQLHLAYDEVAQCPLNRTCMHAYIHVCLC